MSAYFGLAEVGGRPHLTDTTFVFEDSDPTSPVHLDGRPAQQVFDLPLLWETLEFAKFNTTTAGAVRLGANTLPQSAPTVVDPVVCTPIIADERLYGFVLLWGFGGDIPDTRAALAATLQEAHPALLRTVAQTDAERDEARTAIVDVARSTIEDMDVDADHPLAEPLVAERAVEAARSMDLATHSAVATAHGWGLTLNRLHENYVAIRMLRLKSVPLPVTAVLTPQQRRIALLVAEGYTSAQIAHSLGIGEQTVRAHLKGAFKRLNISNRTQLANLLSLVEQ